MLQDGKLPVNERHGHMAASLRCCLRVRCHKRIKCKPAPFVANVMKGVFVMENSRFSTRQLTTNAVKVTFESFPIYIAGFLLGPECGLAVGTLGTFIYQMLMYGFSATTALWILPYSILGLVCGLYAKKHNYDLSAKQYFVMTMLCEFMVTILNTGTIYIDSHIYGYYTPALIIGALGLRLLICFTKGAVFGGIMPKLISTVRRAVVQN